MKLSLSFLSSQRAGSTPRIHFFFAPLGFFTCKARDCFQPSWVMELFKNLMEVVNTLYKYVETYTDTRVILLVRGS